MKDQADNLRAIIKSEQEKKTKNSEAINTRVIAVTSGKGGVGKTNFTINLAISLSKIGKRVIVFDADIGLANVDVILNLKPKYNLSHLINGHQNMKDILYDGPEGIKLIAAGSGINKLFNLKDWELKRFILGIKELENYADIILIDTGAGLSKSVINFLLASDEIITVITPEPTSLTDAYALIKNVINNSSDKNIKIVVNKADNYSEGFNTADKLIKACKNFLKVDIEYLNSITEDKAVYNAVKSQKAFILQYPKSKPSKDIDNISKKLVNASNIESNKKGIREFIKKFTIFFTKA